MIPFTPSQKGAPHQQAMTLVEVIIVIFMISILFILVILETNTLAITRKQTYEDIAYHIANKQMETLRGDSFASLPASASISDSNLSQLPSGSGNFTITNYAGYTGMKDFTVTVSWNDGTSKSVVLETLASSGGVNAQ